MKTYTLNQVGRMLEKLLCEKEMDNWVSKEEFMKRTGLKTSEQLRHFKNKHPELVKCEHTGKTDTMGRSVNRGTIYNIKGWYELHRPLVNES